MSIVTIQIDTEQERLTTTLPTGELIVAPLADGLHALHEAAMSRRTTGAAHAPLVWTDLLATHNVAVGHGGARVRVALVTEKLDPIVKFGRAEEHWRLGPLLWVMDFNRESRRHTDSAMYMLSAIPRSLQDAVDAHAFPYGNVYPHGKICWGEVEIGVTLGNPYAIPRIFFETPFNEDLTRLGGAFVTEVEVERQRLIREGQQAASQWSPRRVWLETQPTDWTFGLGARLGPLSTIIEQEISV